MRPSSPVWNQPSAERFVRLLGLLPVAGEDVIGASQDLVILAGAELHPDGRNPGPGLQPSSPGGIESIPFGRRPVDGEQRRGFGQTVYLDELPAQLLLHPFDGSRGRRRARHDDPGAVPAWQLHTVLTAGCRGVDDGRYDRRGGAEQGHSVAVDAPEDLFAVDLAHDHLRDPIPVTAYGMPQPLQWNIGSVCIYTLDHDADMPAEDGRIQPTVAMRELHALRSGRRPTRVVDARRGGLIGIPRPQGGVGRRRGEELWSATPSMQIGVSPSPR